MSQDIRCVADIARHHARVRPAETAIWFEGAVTTSGELDRLASQCAQALIAAGVTPGERVGVLTKGSDAFFLLWLGCLKAGACLTPVNWRLAPPEIAFVLKDAGCRLVVTGADFAPVIEKIELVSRGDVRRAKLYYLRDLRGKAAKIKERRESTKADAGKADVAAESGSTGS